MGWTLQPFRAVSPGGRRWRRAAFGYATGNRSLGAYIYRCDDGTWKGGRWRPDRHERKFVAPGFFEALVAIDRYLGRGLAARP